MCLYEKVFRKLFSVNPYNALAQYAFQSVFALCDQRLQKRSEQAFSSESSIVYKLEKS